MMKREIGYICSDCTDRGARAWTMQWILIACLVLGVVAKGELLGSDLTIQKATRYVITLLNLSSDIRQGLQSKVHDLTHRCWMRRSDWPPRRSS